MTNKLAFIRECERYKGAKLCRFYSINAQNVKRNSTSWWRAISMKSSAPIAARLPCVIIRGICFRRRENLRKSVREIVKLVAGVGKRLRTNCKGLWALHEKNIVFQFTLSLGLPHFACVSFVMTGLTVNKRTFIRARTRGRAYFIMIVAYARNCFGNSRKGFCRADYGYIPKKIR